MNSTFSWMFNFCGRKCFYAHCSFWHLLFVFVFTIHIVSTFIQCLTFNFQCIPELLTWNLENELWIKASKGNSISSSSWMSLTVSISLFSISNFAFLMTLMNLIFLLFCFWWSILGIFVLWMSEWLWFGCSLFIIRYKRIKFYHFIYHCIRSMWIRYVNSSLSIVHSIHTRTHTFFQFNYY